MSYSEMGQHQHVLFNLEDTGRKRKLNDKISGSNVWVDAFSS